MMECLCNTVWDVISHTLFPYMVIVYQCPVPEGKRCPCTITVDYNLLKKTAEKKTMVRSHFKNEKYMKDSTPLNWKKKAKNNEERNSFHRVGGEQESASICFHITTYSFWLQLLGVKTFLYICFVLFGLKVLIKVSKGGTPDDTANILWNKNAVNSNIQYVLKLSVDSKFIIG